MNKAYPSIWRERKGLSLRLSVVRLGPHRTLGMGPENLLILSTFEQNNRPMIPCDEGSFPELPSIDGSHI